MSPQWVLGQGLPLTPNKAIAPCKAPFPSLLPLLSLLLMAFLPAGVCAGPHLFPVGVPPPPNSAFLDRGTFVWGLDGEQGAFEWLAEDWGHGEGQGLPRVALHWPPAGLQATPNTIAGVGRRVQEPGQGEGTMGSVECRTRRGGFEVKALLGAGRKDPSPLLSREGEGWGKERPPSYTLSLCGPLGQFLNPRP